MTEPLIIETERKVTKAQAQEITNVLFQAKKLIKNPDKKLTNYFVFDLLAMLFCIWNALLSFLLILWAGDDALLSFCMGMMVIVFLFVGVIHLSFLKMRKTLLKREGRATIRLDDEGISYDDHAEKHVGMKWDGISFLRCFQECLCVFPKENLGFMIFLTKEKRDMVKEYLEKYHTDVKWIE